MSILVPTAADEIILGSGYVFFDPEDSTGALTGERYFGQTPGFSVNIQTPNRVQVYSSDSPLEELLVDIASRVDRNATLQVRNIELANLALFVIGSSASQSTSAGSVTAEAVNGVKQGRWYQLGASDTHPAGVRKITTVVVKDAVPTTYTVDTDYKVDLDLGRIYIVEGGTIADDTDLAVDYATTAVTWDEIKTNNLGAQYGALRYIADNTEGPNRDLYAPRVLLAPNGEFALKSRSDVQQMEFQASFLQRTVGSTKRAALYIDGRPA